MSRGLLPSWFNLGLCAAAALLLPNYAGKARAGSKPGTNLPEDWQPEREVLRVTIELQPDAISALRKDPRQYVRGVLKEGQMEFRDVAIHLKGSIGSFRPIDAKPSLTLGFSRFDSGRMFHGTTKIHFNNSVEDPTYLHENLGSLIFSKAGIATPAVRHALVQLNGRPLGMYVVKEGFTHEFLGRHFQDPGGNLYDTETGHEVTDPMERDLGKGPNDRLDLKELANAVQTVDPTERWLGVQHTVDLDEFITFMAIEVMICHRDGYSLARNNYRLYHNPSNDRFVFLPHGMDQLFGRPDFPWRPAMGGLVARAVMSNPEGRARFRQQLGSSVTNLFHVPELTREIERLAALLTPVLPKGEANQFKEAIGELKQKVAARKSFLEKDLSQPEPTPLPFHDKVAALTNWIAFDPPEKGVMNLAIAPDRTPSLHIRAGPLTAASWRCKVLLDRGVYRFEGRVLADRVAPLPYGKNKGARLRVGGEFARAEEGVTGDQPWKQMAPEFTVWGSAEEIELICELRATKGEVWFDRESLRLVQVR